MESDRRVIQPRFGPSHRIMELAQHKTSKTIWATTPCETLSWGNQEPVWPISSAALGAIPSARIQYLSKHKRDFSAREGPGRKDGEASFFRKTGRPSSMTSQYESIVRLSTPKGRRRSSQEQGPPHTPQCDNNCPIWHIHPRVKTTVVTPRLLQLSNPKRNHQDYQGDSVSVVSTGSLASTRARISQRLVQLSLPRVKESNICCKRGHTEESIWTVSRAATRATASSRVEMLARPKQTPKDRVLPREPVWSKRNALFT